MDSTNQHPNNLNINLTSSIGNDESTSNTDANHQSTASRNRCSGQSSTINDSASDLFEEDWYRLNLTPSSSSAQQDAAKVKPENQECDERDRFSPLRFPLSLPITSNIDLENVDNSNTTGALRRPLNDTSRVSSKEEKQRQNEEIVIMESSSVSSETSSWDAVFPHRTGDSADPSIPCETFSNSERRFCAQNAHGGCERQNASDKCAQSTEKSDTPVQSPENISAKLIELDQSKSKPTSCGACFIDASTLIDDGEVVFTQLTSQSNATKSNQENGKNIGAGTSHQTNTITTTTINNPNTNVTTITIKSLPVDACCEINDSYNIDNTTIVPQVKSEFNF